MDLDGFERLVQETLDALPEVFLEKLDHVSIEVRERPEKRDRRGLPGRAAVLGFQQGVSELERSTGRPWELPQRIVIYREPHLAMARDEQHLRVEVRKTVLHEIGHYFGMNEEQLRELGYG